MAISALQWKDTGPRPVDGTWFNSDYEVHTIRIEYTLWLTLPCCRHIHDTSLASLLQVA